jgi:hypothetical protein
MQQVKQSTQPLSQEELLDILQDTFIKGEKTPALQASDLIRDLATQLAPFFNASDEPISTSVNASH